VPDTGGVASPNGAYRAWTTEEPPDLGVVIVDVERAHALRLEAAGALQAPGAQWISEKLLFVRVPWGRVQFGDLVIDVESGRTIYEEAARYHLEAFQQYREACLGQCPCLAEPGSADSLSSPPAHAPAPGEAAGLDALRARSLAYLDEDWDGRVFTESGGRAYTVSMVNGRLSREEYPVDVLDVVEAAGAWWLQVAIYERSRCDEPTSEPVHAGWIPAFSTEGRLVAGSYPGGCGP
jgi:hypothetical protein